jgi:type IV pilus assembly protein PilV
MIEVLVSLVIIAFGLLGLAGLQTRLQLSEFEAYQRSQALLLLDDMASRINTNRINAAAYTGDDVGVGTCPATPATTRVEADLQDWCNALQGAGETQATNKLGAMLGGRGCVEQLASAFSDGGYFRITVAWQGLVPAGSPAVDCGRDAYDSAAGTPCEDDKCRRVVSTVVRIANLAATLP